MKQKKNSTIEISRFLQVDSAIGDNKFENNEKPIQPKLYEYPVSSNKRRFSKNWYENYQWLEYSSSSNSAFCFYCRLFGIRYSSSEKTLISTGFNDWKHATGVNGIFERHLRSVCHVNSRIKYNNRIEQNLNKKSINQELETTRRLHVKKNREYLAKLVETVKFCAVQNIA